MTLFLKKLLLLLTIVSLCCTGLILLSEGMSRNQYEQSYQAAFTDKLQRLKSIDEPKIILVGHSNLAFGINSKKLEDALSMPVVNLGLHGGLGNVFHENFAKANINDGDIVVVCHSSYKLETIDYRLWWSTIGSDKEAFSCLEQEQYYSLMQAYPDHLKRRLLSIVFGIGDTDTSTSYTRNAFNEYGDIVYKPESAKKDVDSIFSKKELSVPKIDAECVERLNKYNQYVSSQGATMVVAGYPIAYGKYSTYTEADFEEFSKSLQEALDCDVISDYTDYFFPYDYFYDTHLHLTQEGADVRTAQLIADLKAWKTSN